jgi:hypothetical protein
MIGMMAGQPAEAACLRALRALAAGEVAAGADFAVAPCEKPGAAFAYDRALRVARLRRDVAEGEVVRGAPAMLSAVRPGQPLTLRTHIGPVVVERQVEVVRPARAGERVLVKGADGRVFAAPPPTAP